MLCVFALVAGALRTPLPGVRPAVRSAVGPRGAPIAPAMSAVLGQRFPSPDLPKGIMGTFGTPEPGPMPIAGERDACGVGFIADTKGRNNHDIVERALHALGCMEHRGGCGGDRVSGDGAGVMTAVPWKLFEEDGSLGGKPSESMGVAMTFLPQDETHATEAQAVLQNQATAKGFEIVGWRDVPQQTQVLGPMARAALPTIRQAFLHHPTLRGDALEAALYKLRRSVQGDLLQMSGPVSETYFASLSSRTIIYKGMVQSEVLRAFYDDLTNELFTSNFAIYHRRFSTNTVPKWPLAQPMRTLAHNGEINTLIGNVNWQRALDVQRGRRDPLCSLSKSDSANLDSVFENLIRVGSKTPALALAALVPEAYHEQPEYDNHPDITDMLDYYAGLQEPWDGPALLTFCDGKQLGASLDRNGLRPARFLETKDGLVAFMSETGVVKVEDKDVIRKGRLGPGNMITIDLETGVFRTNLEVKKELAAQAPYGEWMEKKATKISAMHDFAVEASAPVPDNIVQQMTAFGWGSEDLEMQVGDMSNGGKETLFSMGDDTPLAVLSESPRTLYDYFKQRFAQVTNPPIDPLREGIVMGLDMTIGKRHDLALAPSEELADVLTLSTPVLNGEEMAALAGKKKLVSVSTLYAVADGPPGLKTAVARLCAEAEAAVKNGAEAVVLSDKKEGGLDADSIFIPPLLAVGAVHHHLIAAGLRMRASIVVETAQAWSTHHIACLVGYGASAVHPYLLWQSVRYLYDSAKSINMRETGKLNDISLAASLVNTRKALEAGVLKILSKIGISLLSSYHGAQIFEAIGVGGELIELGFRGTPSRVGGLTPEDLAEEVAEWHSTAFTEAPPERLFNYGFVKYYQKKEHHENTPPMSKMLHKALETYEKDKDAGFDQYKLFQKSIASSPATTIRDMLEMVSDRKPIPLDEVEPVEAIMKRFATGGMSLGALSREAHETLAIGVNRAGGRSNSGEGGEDEARWKPLDDVDEFGHSPTFPHLKGLQNGDIAISKIKQVASGRFGVTPAYLMSAEQIEIKIAQGAKPGEGGQLPGAKVNTYIASIRACKRGVMLISPPPHHDIYSIEDLAQLIYDLHQINPSAKVSVKLVGQVGIGTVASGVAKADADVIQISGHDGGTGASPLTSIKHAGGPWELGLSEAHQALIINQLRDRVVLRVDGGFKTGYDVVMGSMLGADEFGFGTIAMIAVGCVMARICHTNNCPVGVTTQKEALRAKFVGVPNDMLGFFLYVAEETRQVLAHLGYKSLSEITGRADLLKQRDRALHKTSHLDLSFVSQMPDVTTDRAWQPEAPKPWAQTDTLDDELLARDDVKRAIEKHEHVQLTVPITNVDRTVSARVAGAIAKAHGNRGWKGSLHMIFEGCAGQSFGFSCLDGLDLEVRGDANDYVGKSMHGGRIRIRPVEGEIGFDPLEAVIVGNTCLYGATGGRFFASGRAGERFCVRNSKAEAVIEGTGDHCCEYMTGGVVVALGPVGRNVGAGQTGGWGYYLEEGDDYKLEGRVNSDVQMQRVNSVGAAQLKELIEAHVEATGSGKGAAILADWDNYLPKFWQIFPSSEAQAPEVSGVAAAVKDAVAA